MQLPAYETFFRLAPDPACVLDQEGRVLDANQAYLELAGRELDQVRGRRSSALLFDGLDAAALLASFSRARDLRAVDQVCVRPGWWAEHVALSGEKGADVAVLQIIRRGLPVVTEEPGLAEQSLVDVAQAQHLQSVGRLASGVTHTFNNMLQVIGGNLQLLRRSLGHDPVALRRLDAALDGVGRGGKLAAKLLGFAAGHAAEQSVSLAERVDRMLELLSAMLGQGVEVRLEVSPVLWSVKGDLAGLEDLLVEVAALAQRALGGGAQLVIRLENRRQDVLANRSAADYVVLSLSEQAHRVQDGSVSSRASAGGMASLAGIVPLASRLGGLVRPGAPGAWSVEILLPRDDSRAAADAPDRVQELADAQAALPLPLKVLFIEDDPTLRMLTSEVMGELGHDVVVGASAEEALVRLGEAQFDVLFTDIGLPGMDGLELARQARARDPHLVVVIASGYRVDAGSIGIEGVHCVLKPYDIDSVRQLLESIPPRAAAQG